MRKAALFSTLVVLGATFQMASAQDIYIRYDAECVEKLEYRFVEQNNGVAYTAYKVNKNAAENVYFETGIEVPQIRKTAPTKMMGCNAVNLSKADVEAVNKGKRKAFIVKIGQWMGSFARRFNGIYVVCRQCHHLHGCDFRFSGRPQNCRNGQ
jgi:hypothetical protein